MIHQENSTEGQHGLALSEPRQQANLHSFPHPAGQVVFEDCGKVQVFISAKAAVMCEKEREGISQLFGDGLCIMPFESYFLFGGKF